MSAVDLNAAKRAKSRLAQKLSGNRGVTGIGLSKVSDGFTLRLNVLEDDATFAMLHEFEGVDVTVVVTGAGYPEQES